MPHVWPRRSRRARDLWGEPSCCARRAGPTLRRRERAPGAAALRALGRGRPLTRERRLLPAVRAARRAARRGHRGPPRRRRQRDRLAAGRRSGAAGRRRRRPLRVLPGSGFDTGEARRTAGCRSSRPATPAFSQESFAARIPETGSLVSFVRVVGPGRDPAHADGPRPPPVGQPARARLADVLVFGAGARWTGGSLVFRRAPRTPRGSTRRPRPAAGSSTRRGTREARASVGTYWRARLAEGAQLDVPERARHGRASGRCSSRTSSSRGATASATPTRRRRSRRASTARR